MESLRQVGGEWRLIILVISEVILIPSMVFIISMSDLSLYKT